MNYYNNNPALKFQLSHPLMQKIVALKEQNFSEKDTYDYAPRDFEDAIDNYERVLEIIGEICHDIIAPNAESVDQEGPQVINNRVQYARGTQENHEALTQAGLYGISLPRKYGGLNFPIIPYVMAGEMVSRADAVLPIYGACRIVPKPLMNLLMKISKLNFCHAFARVKLAPWT